MDPHWKESIAQILNSYEESIKRKLRDTMVQLESVLPVNTMYSTCLFDILNQRTLETLQLHRLEHMMKHNRAIQTQFQEIVSDEDVILVSVTTNSDEPQPNANGATSITTATSGAAVGDDNLDEEDTPDSVATNIAEPQTNTIGMVSNNEHEATDLVTNDKQPVNQTMVVQETISTDVDVEHNESDEEVIPIDDVNNSNELQFSTNDTASNGELNEHPENNTQEATTTCAKVIDLTDLEDEPILGGGSEVASSDATVLQEIVNTKEASVEDDALVQMDLNDTDPNVAEMTVSDEVPEVAPISNNPTDIVENIADSHQTTEEIIDDVTITDAVPNNATNDQSSVASENGDYRSVAMNSPVFSQQDSDECSMSEHTVWSPPKVSLKRKDESENEEHSMSKKQKTSDHESNPKPGIIDLTEPNVPKAPNADEQCPNKCIICDESIHAMVDHYRTAHTDVYIPIPSADAVNRILNRTDSVQLKDGIISACCVFCEMQLHVPHNEWKSHILSHTGEFEFACTQCRIQLPGRIDHDQCSGDNVHSVFGDEDGTLMAYMCKRCNYIQTHKSRMIRHLSHEHHTIDCNFNKNVEKIVLLPDLCPLDWLDKCRYQFVEDDRRVVCSFTNCGTQYQNRREFQQHFIKYHSNEVMFKCPHCNEVIEKTGKFLTMDIMWHFSLHGRFLNECISCGQLVGDLHQVLNHFVHMHPTKTIMHLVQVSTNNGIIERRLTTTLLQCRVCEARFETCHKAYEHFTNVHQSIFVDLRDFKISKSTFNGATTSKAVTDGSVQTIQRRLQCICRRSLCTKRELIDHFNVDHPKREIMFKLGSFCSFGRRQINDESQIQSVKFDNQMVYYCVTCRDRCDSDNYAYISANDVHDHWVAEHSTEAFQFTVVKMVACAHCAVIGSFGEIKRHQSEAHQNEQLSVTDVLNPRKCALCAHIDDDITEHLKKEHELVLRMNDIDPTCFTDDAVNNLLAIDVHQKHSCGYCDEVFETIEHVEEHIGNKHCSPIKYDSITDDSVKIVTGCCRSFCNLHDFLDHLEDPNHKFASVCTKCNFETNNLFEFIEHQVHTHKITKNGDLLYRRILKTRFWSTRVIFGNGLVMTKHNLLGTEFDDSKPFEKLIDELLIIGKERAQ